MKNLFAFFAVVFLSSAALAFPLPDAHDEMMSSLVPYSLGQLGPQDYDFEGIVALSNCSGSLIRFERSNDSDRAVVLTNGHCLGNGFLKPGEIKVNEFSDRTFTILNSKAQAIGEVKASRLLYATMTATDAALYELRETYAEIRNRFGVRPLDLAKTAPSVGVPIQVISGYWRRGYSCAIEKIVPMLLESDWTFKDSLRYSRPGCETIGGTSGSPVVQTGTRTVIAINNTGNKDGLACAMNNPCEVERDGTRFHEKGISYGQETFWIYSCLDDYNRLNLYLPGCMLPR